MIELGRLNERAQKVLELSLREALQLGHNYVGTEHILLGLIREGDGIAAQALIELGIDLTKVRQKVIQILSAPVPPDQPTQVDVLLAMTKAIKNLRADIAALRDERKDN